MVELNEKDGPGEQRTIYEACGNSNLAHDRAAWTDDGASFCPECVALPAPDDGLVERLRDSAEQLQEYVAEVGPWPSVYKHCATALQSQFAQIERLTRERDEALENGKATRGLLEYAEDSIARLERKWQFQLERADDLDQQVQKLTAALRGLVKAVGGMKNPQTIEDVALLVGVTLGPAYEAARSALEQEGGK